MLATAEISGETKTKVVDGDGHVIERDAELFEFLEPPYQGLSLIHI